MAFLDLFKISPFNVNHSRTKQRNDILKALLDSMRTAFNEDNLVTRYYSLIQWMLENDSEFAGIIRNSNNLEDAKRFQENLGKVLAQAVNEFELKD